MAVSPPIKEPKRAVRRLRRPDWLVILTRTLARREAARHIGL